MTRHDEIVRGLFLHATGLGLRSMSEVHTPGGFADVVVYRGRPIVIEVKTVLDTDSKVSHAVSQVRRYAKGSTGCELWVTADEAPRLTLRGVQVAPLSDVYARLDALAIEVAA